MGTSYGKMKKWKHPSAHQSFIVRNEKETQTAEQQPETKNAKTSVKKATSAETGDAETGRYPMRIPVKYVKKKRSRFSTECVKLVGGLAFIVAWIIFLVLLGQLKDGLEDLNDI